MLKTRPARAQAKPCLEVTFNQDPFYLRFSEPMIAVGSQSAPTVTLEPPVEGTWTWYDWCHLVFEPARALPRATRYRVSLPQGARSLDGKLCKPRSWDVVLDGPKVESIEPRPGGKLVLQPVFRLLFDQPVDPEKVAPLLRLRAGRKRFPLKTLERLEDNMLVVQPETELPRDARITLEVPPGLPSLDGPGLSSQGKRYDYRTFSPLRMLRRGLLEWLSSPDPNQPLRIRFNNRLKEGTARVHVEPELDVTVTVQGSDLLVHGTRLAGQSYQVQVDPMLTDVFGQTLGHFERRKFRPAWVSPELGLPEEMVVVRPGERIPMLTAGLKRVSCALKAVEPEQWEAFFQGRSYRSRPLKTWTQTVPNWGAPETNWLEVAQDVGHRVLEVWAGHLVAALWLQVTELHLQTSLSPEGLSLVVTGADGQPREGASVTWGTRQGRSDSDGHCFLEPSDAQVVYVRHGKDSAFMRAGIAWPRSTESIRWCVFDDRGLYRPGETARLKGWLRRSTGGIPSGFVEYQLSGGSEEKGYVLLSPDGSFDLELTLPAFSEIRLTFEGCEHYHRFRVEDFRRPEFELEVESLPQHPAYPWNEPPSLRVMAAYHSGGALGGASVSLLHQLWERPWTPPGWDEFFRYNPVLKPFREQRSEGCELDEQGLATLTLPFARPRAGAMMEVTTRISVTDQSRQVLERRLKTRLVSREPMVGLRRTREGAELIVVDPMGTPLAGHVVKLERAGQSSEVTSAAEAVPLPLRPGETLVARLGTHAVQVTGWAPTGEALELELSSSTVHPGQELSLRVVTACPYRLGVLRVWAGSRRLQARVFRPGEPLTLRVPEGNLGSLELQLSCLLEEGSWAFHTQVVPVSLASRTLAVAVQAPESGRPGSSVQVSAVVRDASGRPVPGAEVVLMAVDEAVLQAALYSQPDPLHSFYPIEHSHSQLRSLCAHLPRNVPMLRKSGASRSDDLRGGCCYCLGSDVGGGSPAHAAVALRSDLRPLAFYFPALHANAEGRVQVEATLPDSLSRFRVTAIANHGGSFGSGQSSLTTRLPLALRPWLPRFLHQGDRFDFCLGVQNMTAEEREVQVEVTVSGLRFLEGVERTCRVRPGARIEVRFPCLVEQSGPAIGLARAVSGGLEDACRINLPVRQPRFREQVRMQGRSPRELPVEVPSDVELDIGGLELVECDSPIPLMFDAYEGLARYPLSCSEQLSSRLLGWVLGGPHWCPSEWRSRASELVEQLLKRQQPDGQFQLYPDFAMPLPFVSAHAMQALLRAYTAGIELDLQKLSRGMDYLANFPQEATPMEQAYALNVLSQVGRADPERVEALVRHRRLTSEGMAWLLPLTQGRTRARLRARVLASLEQAPVNQVLFTSQRRPAALAFMALGEESGQLERLLDPNPFGTTQDHAFTLLALSNGGSGAQWTSKLSVRQLLEQPRVCLREGPYFRATLTTMPRVPRQEALNHGFGVTRSYELGEVVRIKLTLTMSGVRQMVGLIDPLPAGLELLPRSEQPRIWNTMHCDYRDDCTELCFPRLERGKHEFTVLARATTPGTFLAPGTRVEEMYRPQVFGRGKAQELTI